MSTHREAANKKKKTMKTKKQTNNYRETVAYFKRNNHFSLREDN